MDKHEPVLLEEALAALAVLGDGCYVDGTYGRGGHSAALLARLGPAGRLLALDKDPQAVEHGRRRFGDDPRFTIEHAGFEDLQAIFAAHFPDRALTGLLLDLGTSSPQLDEADRGFSFQQDGPLDMRMNTTRGPTAADWIASATEKEMTRVFRSYGEEPRARRIAAAIAERRKSGAIRTTRALAEIVEAVVGGRASHGRAAGRIHPATRIFQAIRIEINGELDALERGLTAGVELLSVGGRLVVISFHSLEDRIVKRFIAREARGDPRYAGLPRVPPEARPRLRPVGRLVRASESEIARNPRARSARMRVAERIGEAVPA